LEADIGERDDGIYINVHDYSLGEDYTLVGSAALRIENGKLVLVSSSNEQLDVGGGDESRSDVYDPEEPYPSERIEAQSEARRQETEGAETEDDWARYRQEEGLDALREGGVLNYTVVGTYIDNEVFVDHIEADTPQAAVQVAGGRGGLWILSVFEGFHHNLYTLDAAEGERESLLNGITSSRNTDWDYASRWKDDPSAGGLDFEDELVNSHGTHFHLWIPKSDPDSEAKLLQESLQTLRGKRDVIDWSWDYIPEDEERDTEEDYSRYCKEEGLC